MIRTSGGTLMKGTWNWGCLFDLVCLPAKLRFDIYIYIHYIYTHIWEIIYDIYGVSECIWALSPYVLCQVCIHQVLTSQGADQRRAQLQTGEVPIALLHQHGMMVAFSPVLGAWWLSKKHEKPLLLDVWEYWWNVGRMRAFYESVWVSSWWRRCCLCYVGALLCFKCVLCMGVVCLFI